MPGLQHQPDGFRNGHEVTGDFFVRDGEGTALRNLPLEERNYAAVAAQNVAKTSGHKARFVSRMPVFRLNGVFCGALGGAHDVGGVDGLVRRHHHKGLALEFTRQTRHYRRAQAIGAHGLYRMRLHQRHVFVRRGVKNDVRTVPFKKHPHALLVRNIGHQRHQDAVVPVVLQIQFVQRGFRLVHSQQGSRLLQ